MREQKKQQMKLPKRETSRQQKKRKNKGEEVRGGAIH